MASFGETLSRVTKVGIALLSLVFQSARAGWCGLVGSPVPGKFVVLMYHSVKAHERERFARQMDDLVSVGRPVSADFPSVEMTNGATYVAVTFDDAYRSVIELGFPILSRLGVPGT